MSKVIKNLIQSNKDVYAFMLDKVSGEGYEVLLNDGYSVDGLHSIAGDTVKDILLQASFIQKCSDDCSCKNT
jgi:hypothetical protein